MDKVKRERSANFSLQERDILVSLVSKYQTVLENKISDGTTWKKKETAWENIKNEFNARSGVTYRSTKTLKVKYEGLKRTVRKKSATIRSELYRTGGGQNTAPPLDNVEERVKTMIKLSTDGLESVYDSDVIPLTQDSEDGIHVPEMTIVTEMDELSEISSLPINSKTEVVERETTPNEVVILVTNECKSLPPPSTSAKSEQYFQQNHLNDIVTDDNSLNGTPSKKCVLTPTSSNKKWDVTSRRNLKSRKHPALVANVQQRNSFDELTQAKLELVQLQKSILEAEIVEKKQVWKFEDSERRKESEFREKEHIWKEEEYKLKLEKLRKELKE